MNYPSSGASSAAGMLGGVAIFVGIFSLAVFIFAIIIYWRIVSKAGYNGALSLLLLVPVVNLVMLCIFAFSEWPIQKELNQLRQQVAMGQQPYPQYAQNPQYPQNMPQGQPYPQNSQYPQNMSQSQQYPQYPQNPQ